MKIIVTPRSGFCAGVKRALSMVDAAIESGRAPVYTLGPIIHNPGVVEAYRKRGVEPLEKPDDLPAGAVVVIRAHGAPLDVEERLSSSPVKVVDATCEQVMRVRRLIERELAAGRYVYIAGDAGHPEVAGHLSRCGGRGAVIGNAADAETLDAAVSPASLVSQTTFSEEEFEFIAEILKRKIPDFTARESACGAVSLARREAARVAAEADVMLVIGGRNSANTRLIAEACAEEGTTRLVESAEELRREWFSGAEVVGIAAGASTPPDSVEAVKSWLREELDATEKEKDN